MLFLFPSILFSFFQWFLSCCWEERWQKACWMTRVFIDFFWKYFCQKQANTALIALIAMVVLAPPGYLAFKWEASTSSVIFCQSLWYLTCVNGSVHHFVMCFWQRWVPFDRPAPKHFRLEKIGYLENCLKPLNAIGSLELDSLSLRWIKMEPTSYNLNTCSAF